ncbi:AIPR family protein [Teredinibacter turnerae]|uniref:AIPR family protein n=1 Tax=Teredinibacter turnerae TaxID=2426 RepID=UPI0030D24FB1
MDRIIKSHLKQFSEEHAIEFEPEDVRFEKFANFAVLQAQVAKRLDLELVTTGADDDGIDGVAVVINEELVVGKGEATSALYNQRKNNDVEIIFIQSKTSASIDLGDFLKFKEAILRLIGEEGYSPSNSIQKEAREALDIVIENVAKIRNGRPNIRAVYASGGSNEPQGPHHKARDKAKSEIDQTKCFDQIAVEFVNADYLISEWVASYSSVEVDLEMHSHAGLPQIEGIEESYLAVIRAKEFVEKLLLSTDGNIRSQLFEDNVRHYLGDGNDVNSSIAQTISDPQKRTRFPVLNNGITIVSPDVVVRTNKLHVRDPQIVNGCQTSHVLFENRNAISDEMMLTVKIVEAEDEDVYTELVQATNSQSKVEGRQFLSLSPMAREIEAYFNTFEGEDGRLYFERRLRQYAGKNVPALRIIDLDTVARAFAAMYLKRPDLAFKYPKAMYEQLGGQLFAEGNKASLYYAGALIIYRIHLLTSSGAVTSTARKYKWHILPLVCTKLAGTDVPKLNSKKAEVFANKIVGVFRTQSQAVNDVLSECVDLVLSLDDLSTDKLRRQATLGELLHLMG